MISFAIWLAKTLIVYFLKTNLQLKNELADNVARNEELALAIEDARKMNLQYDKEIVELNTLSIQKYQDLQDVYYRLEERKREIDEKQKELTNVINNKSDADIVRIGI